MQQSFNSLNKEARAHRSRRIFYRAMFFTCPVIAGYLIGREMLQHQTTALALDLLFGLLALILAIGALQFIADRLLSLARLAPTPFLRFAATIGMIALPCLLHPAAFLLIPLFVLAAAERWLMDSRGKSGPARAVHPFMLTPLRLLGQTLCGITMAVAWKFTATTLQYGDQEDEFLPMAAVGVVVWSWLIVAIARTTWPAAMEPERKSA